MLKNFTLVLMAFVLVSCVSQPLGFDSRQLRFDQQLQGKVSEKFIPNASWENFDNVSCISFSADGRQMAFAMLDKDKLTNVYVSHYVDGSWLPPKALDGRPKGKHWGFPTYSLEGGYDIYLTEAAPIRQKVLLYKQGNWEAKDLSEPIGNKIRWGVTHSKDHVAFFGSTVKDKNDDLFFAKRNEDGYGQAIHLPYPINSEANETRPFISADRDYLIFESNRGGRKPDLYVTFAMNKENGKAWSDPIALGPEINTEHLEDGPWVSPDGKILFFRRFIESQGDEGKSEVSHIYWVDMSVVYDLDPRKK